MLWTLFAVIVAGVVLGFALRLQALLIATIATGIGTIVWGLSSDAGAVRLMVTASAHVVALQAAYLAGVLLRRIGPGGGHSGRGDGSR